MGLFYPTLPRPIGATNPTGPSAASLAGVALAHAALIAFLSSFVPTEQLAELTRPLAVRLVELAPLQPVAQAKAPPRPTTQSRPQAMPAPAPAAVLAAPTPAPAHVAFAAPDHPIETAIPPVPAASPAARPAPLQPPRFDADYLNNPKPAYPTTSRRLGEEGKVVLRVLVNVEGRAAEVAVKGTSGYPRLDTAAREAVSQWRFVPARRGDESIADWVLVPVVFSLEG